MYLKGCKIFSEMFCACVLSISSPLSSHQQNLPFPVLSHPPRNYSCQRRSFNVPLVVLLWVEEWWSRGKLTSWKTHGAFFIHIFLYLILFVLYSGWLGKYFVFENCEAIRNCSQRMSVQRFCTVSLNEDPVTKGTSYSSEPSASGHDCN